MGLQPQRMARLDAAQRFGRLPGEGRLDQRFALSRAHHLRGESPQPRQVVSGQQFPHERQHIPWPQPLIAAGPVREPEEQGGEQPRVRQLPGRFRLACLDHRPETTVAGHKGVDDRPHGPAVQVRLRGGQQTGQLLGPDAVAQSGELVEENRLAHIPEHAGVVEVEHRHRPLGRTAGDDGGKAAVDLRQVFRVPVFRFLRPVGCLIVGVLRWFVHPLVCPCVCGLTGLRRPPADCVGLYTAMANRMHEVSGAAVGGRVIFVSGRFVLDRPAPGVDGAPCRPGSPSAAPGRRGSVRRNSPRR